MDSNILNDTNKRYWSILANILPWARLKVGNTSARFHKQEEQP